MVAELIGEHLSENGIAVESVKRFGCTRPT